MISTRTIRSSFLWTNWHCITTCMQHSKSSFIDLRTVFVTPENENPGYSITVPLTGDRDTVALNTRLLGILAEERKKFVAQAQSQGRG